MGGGYRVDGSKAPTLATKSNLGHLTSSLDPSITMETLACVVMSCHRQTRVLTTAFTGVPGKQRSHTFSLLGLEAAHLYHHLIEMDVMVWR